MVAASGPALRQLAAPCPRTIGGSRSAFVVRFTQPVALRQQQQLRCCASEPRLPRVVGIGSKIIGCGSATPSLSVSNDDLSKILDTSDEWITARTGIRNRRILSGDETLGELSIQAAQRALEMAQVKAVDVDMLILCASTPDDLFGSSAQVSIGVGCTKAHGHDIRAGCCGFVDGLFAASSFIKGSNYHNILVVGADALSKFVDWTDRGTCILFGDAAGAVLVQACSAEEDGMLGFSAQNDGSGQKHLNARIINDESILSKSKGVPEFPFPPRKATYSCIEMNGKEVFRFAVRCVPPSIEEALEVAGLPVSSIDWLLLHQANQRIIDTVASRLDIPSEKVISNIADYGNTGAASIPLALDEAVRSGLVKAVDIIAVSGFGAGLKWGSAIVRWG